LVNFVGQAGERDQKNFCQELRQQGTDVLFGAVEADVAPFLEVNLSDK
jgi:hypothetical protein